MKRCALALALFLSACAGGDHTHYLRMHDLPLPTPESFSHCYDYGCKTRAMVSVSPALEKNLRANFKPVAKTAEAEQKQIATAIQIFEKDIGALTGTKNDKYGTFRLYQDDAESMKMFQQDCVDESTNTTVYLSLLQQMGLMTFHRPAFPTARQPFFGGSNWWHQTATMEDIATGQRFAVDSWFRDNGYPAFIVPLQEWKDGWRPEKQPNEG